MSTWIGLLGLYLTHQIAAVFTVWQAVRNRWSPAVQLASSAHRTPPPPKCIAIVLTDVVTTEKDTKQLALVLNWCNSQQVQKAVLYDPRGLDASLTAQLKRQLHDVQWCDADQDRASTTCQDTNKWLQPHNAQMAISLISYNDSLHDIVATAQQTQGLDVTSCNQGNKPATAAWLSSKLQNRSASAALEEPDLLLVFGNHFSLAGYPPWPIRVTEMYHMGQLSRISLKHLENKFIRYSRTMQRFGS